MRGRVEFDDGTPLVAGMVTFETEDRLHCAIGPLRGVDGHFEVSWDGHNDGLPPGRYRIMINRPGPYGATREQIQASPGPDWGVQNKYLNVDTSGLEVVVDSPLDEYVIRLEKSRSAGSAASDRWKRQRLSTPE